MRVRHFRQDYGNNLSFDIRQQDKAFNSNLSIQKEKGSSDWRTDTTELKQSVCDINKILENKNVKVEYSIHEQTNRLMLKVYSRADDKLIKEIPSERMLDILAGIMEYVGVLLDERI